MQFFGRIAYRFHPEESAESLSVKMNAQLRLYLDADEEQYEKWRKLHPDP